eukprot:TRINITY_DN6775_c0_g1_i2.p1 TRINITY_DN6775_c0_g1~~TRINITY_DN6775_c0_g1_i2.p1  ORF type:complete len:434 (-),score=43.86 TRINITY_DN6775_c0_g1_i2:942-2180(-)
MPQKERMITELCACLRTLFLFCSVEPLLLKSYAPLLVPLFTNEQGMGDAFKKQHALVLQILASLFTLLLPIAENLDEPQAHALESTLLRLINTHTYMNVVKNAIQCLCVLVNKVTGKVKVLEDLLLDHLSHFDSDHTPQSSSAGRYLFNIGFLSRHHDTSQSDSIDTERLFSLLMANSRDWLKDHSVAALQGLSQLLIRYPAYLRRQECATLIVDILQAGREEAQLQLLKFYQEMLSLQERSLGLSSSSSTLAVCGDATFHDQLGICGASIQANSGFLFDLLHSSLPRVRCAALQVVEDCLNLGLLHPMQCVTELIARTMDTHRTVRDRSFKRIASLYEKQSSQVVPRLLEGIFVAFRDNTSIRQSDQLVSEGGYPESQFHRLYMLLKTNKANRAHFLKQLVKCFEDPVRTH